MNNRSKSFNQLSKAWYGKDTLYKMPNVVDRINICVSDKLEDISLFWEKVADQKIICRIEIWDNGWQAFDKEPKLFKHLGRLSKKGVTPDQMVKILKKMKYQDLTKFELQEVKP